MVVVSRAEDTLSVQGYALGFRVKGCQMLRVRLRVVCLKVLKPSFRGLGEQVKC